MDWSPSEEPGGGRSSAAAGQELQELSFSMLPASISSGRRLGHKISHKKSASDTFAFAAGQDFLSLLAERPLHEEAAATHARHASTGAELAGASSSAGRHIGGEALIPQAAGGSFTSLHGSQADSPSLSGLPRSPAAAAADPAASDTGAGMANSTAAAAGAGAAAEGGCPTRSNALDTTQLDPRKAKRILANRQSAQRSRMKRLQYISELEGRKAKAEAGVRDLRSKVDKAQRGQAGLAAEVEEKRTELNALEQQLLYEQAMQANLSSYLQSLQLQYQQQQQPQQQQQQHHQQQLQQQQWSYSPDMACAYQVQQTQVQCTSGAHLQNGTYSYNSATASQYAAVHAHHQQQQQHHHSQQQQQQQQQQWVMPPTHQQALQMQSQACGYEDYNTAPHLQLAAMQQQEQEQQQQRRRQQRQQQEQQPASVLAAPQGLVAGQGSGQAVLHISAAQAAAATGAAALPAAAAGGGGAAATLQRHLLQQQHQQQDVQCSQMPGAAAVAGSGAFFTPAAGAAGAAEGAAAVVTSPTDAAAAAAAAASQPEGLAATASRGSLSQQGSGSVLMHGSLSDPDLESLLGLDAAGGSSDIRGLLGEGDSDFLLPPDELLLRDHPGSLTVKEEEAYP